MIIRCSLERTSVGSRIIRLNLFLAIQNIINRGFRYDLPIVHYFLPTEAITSPSMNSWNAGSNHFSPSILFFHTSAIVPC